MDSFLRPISPPRRKRDRDNDADQEGREKKRFSAPTNEQRVESTDAGNEDGIRIIRSPIRLYRIKDLPDSENVDAVTLRELFAPASTLDEIWTINFMTDMSFLRGLIGHEDDERVKIQVIHGYWRQEDESRKLMEAGVWSKNIRLIAAYLPDAFGTHHSKVIVLFRTDDTAQVLVHTGTDSA
jgi:tyrosyl-DNA phosphodiesterase 1